MLEQVPFSQLGRFISGLSIMRSETCFMFIKKKEKPKNLLNRELGTNAILVNFTEGAHSFFMWSPPKMAGLIIGS